MTLKNVTTHDPAFEIKDSGAREKFDSGMVRDTEDGKADYTLILDGPMVDRWAEHLTKGAKKYAPRNWMKAEGEAEYERFRRSALRHFLQWLRGERDEDHAAAVLFNINGAEYVREKLPKDADADGFVGFEFTGEFRRAGAGEWAYIEDSGTPYPYRYNGLSVIERRILRKTDG